ncbi:MAG: hypothetical protein AAFP82_09070, partial [Bacteroidota bacterium]
SALELGFNSKRYNSKSARRTQQLQDSWFQFQKVQFKVEQDTRFTGEQEFQFQKVQFKDRETRYVIY